MIDKQDAYVQYLNDITNIRNYNITDIKESIVEFKESLTGDMKFDDINSVEIRIIGLYKPHNFISPYNFNKEYIDSQIVRLREGYKPCIVPEFQFTLIDDSEKEDILSERYNKYATSVIVQILKSKNIKYDVTVLIVSPDRGSRRYTISLYLTSKRFQFKDILDKSNLEEHILRYNSSLSKLYPILGEERTNKLIDDNPYLTKGFSGEGRLKYDKHRKKKNDPQRAEMEENNTMYVFISRPKFVESENGNYTKDIEIENMVPIDPYDSNDLLNVNMMQLRARSQDNQSKVHCIWIPKDAYDENELMNINNDEYKYLRDLIDKHKERL